MNIQSELEEYRNQSAWLLQQFKALREQNASEDDRERKSILMWESIRYLDENEKVTFKISDMMRKLYHQP